MMLSDALDEYLNVRKRQIKPTTHRNVTKSLKRFLADVGNLQLRNLKATHVEKFFYEAPEDEDVMPRFERLQPGSFNTLLQHVRGFLTWCERRGYVRRDLLAEIAARKVIKRERMRLSPSQMLALLDLSDHPRDRVLIAIALNTGMRANDITRLKISDVNLEARTLRCVISKSDLEVAKPITADLDQELRRWLLYYAAAEKDTYRQVLQDDWFLVPSLRRWRLRTGEGEALCEGERILPTARLQTPHRPVKRALAALGLDGTGEGVHTIRRSVARAYFESLRAQGYDGALQATKALLDHSDSKITEYYLGLTHERQVLDQTLAGQPFLSAMVEGDSIFKIADYRKDAKQA